MSGRKPTRAKGLGVTDEQYAAMLAAQGGGCAICGTTPKTEHDSRPWQCRYCKHRNTTTFTVCESCLRKRPKPRGLDVDHDHGAKPIKVRGLLCHRCNRALPNWIGPKWLLAAAVYLAGGDAAFMRAALAGLKPTDYATIVYTEPNA